MSKHPRNAKGRNARRALVLAPLIAAGGCSTTDLELLGLAMQLYEVSAYMNGDCPYGQTTYYDSWNDRYSCGYPVRGHRDKARGDFKKDLAHNDSDSAGE